ncbi:MAG: DNA-protecting protein DprA [Chloroflexi bacterium]|nr:DNA-protecting protein DprA [Chloroflexota bacterium]
MDDTKYWVAFARLSAIGTVRTRLLERAFGTLEQAWRAPSSALQAAGLDQRSVRQLVATRDRIDPDEEMQRLGRLGFRVITWHGSEYPASLKEIHDPPPLLFVWGSLLAQDQRAVAVVGTRRATAYGREACETLVRGLAAAGVTIVSGLARGIDGVAHQATLGVGGRTIAVLGSGLDVIYPHEHRALAEAVAQTGAVVSELPLGSRPDARNFPRRNRLLSGMTMGVLVVEAPEDSGAMWTVHWALEQGREVFVVPGSIFSPASRGANRLIQEGANPVLQVEDILEELNLSTLTVRGLEAAPSPTMEGAALGEDEARILQHIGHEPVHIDELSRRLRLPIPTVSSTLAVMEIEGLVKQVGGMHYQRARELPVAYTPR